MGDSLSGIILAWSVPLRSTPSKDYTRPYVGVLKDLPRGTRVLVLGVQGSWLHVKVTFNAKTLTGYVARELVKLSSQAEAAPSKPTATPPLTTLPRVPSNNDKAVKAQPSATPFYFDRSEVLDGLQGILDVVGFIPGLGEIADLTNAGISALRGNYLDAALSVISLIPGVGDAIGKGAKYALKFADAKVARNVLSALRKVDFAGFFNRLVGHPQLAKYVKSLQQSLYVLTQKMAHLAGEPTPMLAMAGGGHPSPGAWRNNVVETSGNLASGYRRGDHVFNNGLTKLGLVIPRNSLLGAAFHRFQNGLKNIEAMGGFKLVADKGAHAEDLNSRLFGEGLEELRKAWAQLDRTIADPRANAQTRAVAVLWTTDALKKLRQASFDQDAVLARLRQANGSQSRAIKQQVEQTTRQLDAVFDGLIKEVERFMPSPTAVGQSMAGHGGGSMLRR